MIKFKIITSLLLSILLTSSCATIFKGTSREVSFNIHDGAEVYINGELKGKTPLKIKLQNDKSYTVAFKKDGKQIAVGNISKSVSAGWIILDVLTGLVPIVIDAVTGSWYYLEYDGTKDL